MPTFNGVIVSSGPVGVAINATTSTDLATFNPDPNALGAALVNRFSAAPLTRHLGSNEPRIALGGSRRHFGGRELFNKVIITPNVKALGFVLDDITWTSDVWNTFTDTIVILTAIQILDSGNVQVANPYTLPLALGPGGDVTFLTTVPGSGDATINATLTFVVTGVSGTGVLITGLRINVFSPDADWEQGISEKTEYLTTIIPSYAKNEQRYALRKTPRTRLKYKVITGEGRDTAFLDALLFAWQSRLYGVPAWMDAQPLTAQMNAGDTVITVDPSYRKFAVGGLVMLWRDMHTTEVATISAVGVGSVTITAPINNTWAADGQTFVVPALKGRLPDAVDVLRHTTTAAEVELDFECEVI